MCLPYKQYFTLLIITITCMNDKFTLITLIIVDALKVKIIYQKAKIELINAQKKKN